MKRFFIVMALVALAVVVVKAGKGERYSGGQLLEHNVTDAGDTAMVMYWVPTSAIDSQTYACSLLVGADTVVPTYVADTGATDSMICVGVAAVFNENDTAAALVIASLAATYDTVFITQLAGIGPFTLLMEDTASAIDTVTAAVTSTSSDTDTAFVCQMWPNGFKSLAGDIIVQQSITPGGGYGLSDSIIVTLFATSGFGSRLTIAADTCGGCPCSLHVAVTANDTLWRDRVEIGVQFWDTATAVANTRYHPVDYTLIATD